MSAQFVARVLSCCLGAGTIALKGRRQRPWLEIIRSETERPYLSHQLKQLRDSHLGKLEFVIDVLPCDGFYDDVRLRVRSDELYRAYELMYPRDKKIVTPQILDITGIGGLSALWSDRGRIIGRIGKVHSRFSPEGNVALANWCNANDFECKLMARKEKSFGIQFTRESTKAFIAAVRPHTHKIMRKRFKPTPARR